MAASFRVSVAVALVMVPFRYHLVLAVFVLQELLLVMENDHLAVTVQDVLSAIVSGRMALLGAS